MQLYDARTLYPRISLHNLQAVPLKSLPAVLTAYTFAKSLVNLTAFPTFLSLMIFSLPLREAIPLRGDSYTTPRHTRQRNLQVCSMHPCSSLGGPLVLVLLLCRVGSDGHEAAFLGHMSILWDAMI